ncbi:MCM DNA helicase complex subunit [Rhodotorula toruloides]|uniref:DNA replication licensing factor MCM2 n=2 Tax=Rhodotorula toruloides TaxID=5286 RepID=A0A061ALR4_RHOTO|nr:minichromosome maintenance protein 2 [Rhodotorula toruloides NP11]EMS21826.1 minichromosome maintenance protein 2 [Rhodotorula toruloides NP11]CDR35684.1 RHTO0S01e04830g1_1 [Rhodotorula toruloides]
MAPPGSAQKRRRSPSRERGAAPSSDPAADMQQVSTPAGSLPGSSPPPATSDFEEEDIYGLEDGDLEEEEDGEDLFDENMGNDYIENRKLDVYDQADLNDQDDFSDDQDARRAAEASMERRDRRAARAAGAAGERRKARMPGFLASDEEDSEDEGQLLGRRRVRRMYDEPFGDDDAGYDEEMPLEQLGDVRADSLSQWIEEPRTRRTIAREFRNFLLTCTDENNESVYGSRITQLGQLNSESLEVSFIHLSDSKPILAYFLANCPSAMLPIFDEVALDVILLAFPHYTRIHAEVHVRITELPTSYTLRDLRQSHLDALVRVSGVVTRRSGVFPQLKYVKFDCGKCGETLGPFYQDAASEIKISFCSACNGKGPFTVNSEQTVYRNYQKLTLQESPGSVPAGRLPRHREVILLWDLIDSAKPGDEIEVTGIYRNNFDTSLNVKNGFPVFSTVIEANHVNKKEDLFASFRLTEDDEKAIRKLARDERIGKRIIKSMAPSIYGHDDIKTAVALSLFGGVPKDINRKHRIRGDINVLMLGDPGTAKSQFLKYVEKTANRAVFATGQGASAVGLTASVRKDPVTREWTLEGGALVLADKGVCLIDEFDKMNDSDRTSIHEAMEQQSISISKAGIVTTLQARCAIVAAANPIRGRYNPTIPFSQNVELTEPILSRFDILCVVKDEADPSVDEMLANFVVGSHLRSHPNFDAETDEVNASGMIDADLIPQDLLRKYIQYARDRVKPQLHMMDQEKISRLYSELRRESLSTGSYPITVRHLESMIRMAEASAKMHLREYVRSDDIDLAIQVMVGSFVSAQKSSIKKQLQRGFRKYLRVATDNEEVICFLLGNLVKDRVRYLNVKNGAQPDSVSIRVEELARKAAEIDIHDIEPFFSSALFSKVHRYSRKGDSIYKSFV